ncbi:MAG: hypothetical protein NVSMB9_27010 [Isosphaeraceae bacterium]
MSEFSGNRASSPRVAVIVASIDAKGTVGTSVSRFAEEVRGRGEVILVDASRDGTGEEARKRFPTLRILQCPPGSLTPELWGEGLRSTDADFVAFSTAAMVPRQGWLNALLDQLARTGAAAVGGPIEPGENLTPFDRAIYLLRFLNYRVPFPSPHALEPPGDNALYPRDRLVKLDRQLSQGFWEAEVHRVLRGQGEHFTMAQDAVVTYSGGGQWLTTLRQRHGHAYQFGACRSQRMSRSHRLVQLAAGPLVPLILFQRIVAALRTRRLPLRPWASALPGLSLLLSAWAWGEMKGIHNGIPPRTRAA